MEKAGFKRKFKNQTNDKKFKLRNKSEDGKDKKSDARMKRKKKNVDKPRRVEDSSLLAETATDEKSEPKPSLVEGEEEEEEEIEIQTELDDVLPEDPFSIHLENELSPGLLNALSSKPPLMETKEIVWPALKNIHFTAPSEQSLEQGSTLLDQGVTYAKPGQLQSPLSDFTLEKCYFKSQIIEHIKSANQLFNDHNISGLQEEIMQILCNYQSFFFPGRDFSNAEEVRLSYCCHAINHVLKSRLKILHHNAKLSKKSDHDFRDQGLVRPKVLILLPFRDSALRVFKMMSAILLGDSGHIMNKKRFYDDYGGTTLILPKKHPKPADYEQMFAGNTDDNFRIGISITKKSMKLYSDFYNSDIIMASPLALRMLVGAEGERDRDYDFLSSIEVLIMDQAEVFYYQNWEHVLHIMEHLHLVPKESHNTDMTRVRMWTLNGWPRYYLQLIMASSYPLPELAALFNANRNFAGRVAVTWPVTLGTIRLVAIQTPQVFHHIAASSVAEAVSARFDTFVNKFLPQFQDPLMKQTLIYVPSYFDYVKIRNHFKKHDVSFVQICEYSKEGKISRARSLFFHGEVHFMLYSERFHFFRRMRIRGIKHILFYQPPSAPHFYSEMCNFLQDIRGESDDVEKSDISVTVMYTKYDVVQLASIVDTSRAMSMLASNQPVHMFMTDS